MTLTWSASSENTGGSGLAGYKIYRQRTPTSSNTNLPVGTVGPNTPTFTDPHLQPSTSSYVFTVVAFDKAQNHSAASNAVTVTTPSAGGDTAVPDAPAGVRGRNRTGSPAPKTRPAGAGNRSALPAASASRR